MIDALTAAIQKQVVVHQARAQAVERAPGGFRVRVADEWLEAEHLVIATEAHSGAALLRAVDGRLSELLGSVPYSSSMTVALGFDAKDFAQAPEGHGFLVPKKERQRLMACTWVGTKFPYRVPEGKIVARCFLGGMEDAEVLAESDEAVTAIVTRELERSPACARNPNLCELRAGRGPWRNTRWDIRSAWRRWRRARRQSRAFTLPAMLTRASASPTASAWASGRRKASDEMGQAHRLPHQVHRLRTFTERDVIGEGR